MSARSRRRPRPSSPDARAFPLSQSTLQLATTPQQPGHTEGQVAAANDAFRRSVALNRELNYPAIAGVDLRGFGWDIDIPHSRPRGTIFPIGSFGHTGFTGVTMWLDPDPTATSSSSRM